MAERRSLVEGMNAPEAPKEIENEFVYGPKGASRPAPISTPRQNTADVSPEYHRFAQHRVPITTRTRPEVAAALKRASLQRQLEGKMPHYVQDIFEVAIETWLRDNGYLD